MAIKQPTSTKETYRNLVGRLRNLVINPVHEWNVIHGESSNFNDLLSGFSLPLIGLVTLTTFLNYLINQQALIFELALKQALIIFSSFFVGLLAAYYLLQKIIRLYGISGDETLAAKLVVYSSAPLYVVSVVTSLVPEVFFIQILSLYSFYLGWIGLSGLPELRSDKKPFLSIFLAFCVLAPPVLIRFLFLNLLSI